MDPQQVIDQYNAFAQELYSSGIFKKKDIQAAQNNGGWSGYLSKKDANVLEGLNWGSSSRYISKLDLEEATPFIRAVLERALDLLESEEHWVKQMAAATATGKNVRPEADQADKWCLIGVIARAEHDLRLVQDADADTALNAARSRVCGAVKYFFEKAMADDHHMAMPTWNDHPDTTFEDVRLWLKSMFDRLDDVSV